MVRNVCVWRRSKKQEVSARKCWRVSNEGREDADDYRKALGGAGRRRKLNARLV